MRPTVLRKILICFMFLAFSVVSSIAILAILGKDISVSRMSGSMGVVTIWIGLFLFSKFGYVNIAENRLIGFGRYYSKMDCDIELDLPFEITENPFVVRVSQRKKRDIVIYKFLYSTIDLKEFTGLLRSLSIKK